jgi:hypothetical protein
MASVYNYSFNNLTRIGDDTCGITARDSQNNAMGSYNTTNYFANWCGRLGSQREFTTGVPEFVEQEGATFNLILN